MTNLDIKEIEKLDLICGDILSKKELSLEDQTKKRRILGELAKFKSISPIAVQRALNYIEQINSIPN